MELTLTMTGSPEEIRRVLDILEGRDEPVDEGAITDRGLRRFVAIASPPMLATLRAVVIASGKQESIARGDLAEAAGLGGEAELNGVLGSIGRAWARAIGTENPFLGATDAAGAIVYRIDHELAERIEPLLAGRDALHGFVRGRGFGRRNGRGRRGMRSREE